jgi:hypothetical protein
MFLYGLIPLTPELEKLASEAALHLFDKRELPTEEETVLYRYRWTEECSKLVHEFSKTKVCMRKLILGLANYIKGGRG